MSGLTVMNNKQVTITSLEIAELTNKRHGNVIRDIEKLLNELEVDRLKLESVYLGGNSEKRKMYELPRDLVENLLMGYSAKLRQAVIKRLHELEEATRNKQPELPHNYHEALIALTNEVEKTIMLESEIKQNAPRIEAFNKIIEIDNELSLNEGAKILGVGRNTLIKNMREDGVILQGKGTGVAQKYLNAGYFIVVNSYVTTKHGDTVSTATAKFTQKGLYWLARKYDLEVSVQNLNKALGVSL